MITPTTYLLSKLKSKNQQHRQKIQKQNAVQPSTAARSE